MTSSPGAAGLNRRPVSIVALKCADSGLKRPCLQTQALSLSLSFSLFLFPDVGVYRASQDAKMHPSTRAKRTRWINILYESSRAILLDVSRDALYMEPFPEKPVGPACVRRANFSAVCIGKTGSATRLGLDAAPIYELGTYKMAPLALRPPRASQRPPPSRIGTQTDKWRVEIVGLASCVERGIQGGQSYSSSG